MLWLQFLGCESIVEIDAFVQREGERKKENYIWRELITHYQLKYNLLIVKQFAFQYF